jgi:NAD(P)-dependent dehydrogenase (short-subunit alcohol dehydrogenase family)
VDSVITLTTVKRAEFLEHFTVDIVEPGLLSQAVLPLLQKSANPRSVAMSSSAASIGAIEYRPFPNAVYGASKAQLNYITSFWLLGNRRDEKRDVGIRSGSKWMGLAKSSCQNSYLVTLYPFCNPGLLIPGI